jgi:acetyl-CoA C-acetyltransferase
MMGEMAFDAVINQRYPEVERVNHVHTPGNSSGIVDGSAGRADRHASRPARRWASRRARRSVGAASIGSEPSIMLTGPEFVAKKLLAKLGMTTADIDLYELNEAFAAVVLRYMQALDIDARQDQRERRRPSPWATHWAPPAP